jgi:hypothetical protein
MHWALYAGLAAAVVLGMLNAWARGDSIFSLLHIPKLLPANAQLQPAVEYLHKTFANAAVARTNVRRVSLQATPILTRTVASRRAGQSVSFPAAQQF